MADGKFIDKHVVNKNRLIICGDFNLTFGNKEYTNMLDILELQYNNDVIERHSTFLPTHIMHYNKSNDAVGISADIPKGSKLIYHKVDYILSTLPSTSATVIYDEKIKSDHMPVTCTFKV